MYRTEAITPGPGEEKALWFTDSSRHAVGKITTSGTITECQSVGISDSVPDIVAGFEKEYLWLTISNAEYPEIGKFKASLSKLECELGGGLQGTYSLGPASEPYDITMGPEKEDLWFTEHGKNDKTGKYEIGKITPSGTILLRGVCIP